MKEWYSNSLEEGEIAGQKDDAGSVLVRGNSLGKSSKHLDAFPLMMWS